MHDHERRLNPDHPAPRSGPSRAGEHPVPVSRSPALDTAAVLHLQRTAGNQSVVQLLAAEDETPSPVHEVVGSGGGAPLDGGTRATMESAFGASFDGVRVHTDAQASRSAESVGANAYTVGSDVVFRSGQYDPGSAAGQKTLAHELAHVVQQSRGPVDGAEAPGGIKVSNPSDRFERAADQTADHVLGAVGAGSAPAPSGGGGVAQLERDDQAPAAVQRAVPTDEEEQQG